MKEVTTTVADHILGLFKDGKYFEDAKGHFLTKTEIKRAPVLSEYHPGYISVVLTRLVKKGTLRRSSQGVYILPDAGGDE